MKEYFSHDYNARNDKKITKLLMKHGVSGIGIYWCIIEMLFEESGYLNIDEYERISFELRTDYKVVKSVIEDFELFSIDGIKFWSDSAISRLTERMNKSAKARASVMKRWNKVKSDTNVLQTNSDSNTIKVKQSKENEYIYNAFYDSEILKSDNGNYPNFVKYLFGENMLNEKLVGVLSIKNQLTFNEYKKISDKCEVNKLKLGQILTKIENDVKYYKGKKSLYRTLLNWAEGRFAK